jgi:hypothetical protein
LAAWGGVVGVVGKHRAIQAADLAKLLADPGQRLVEVVDDETVKLADVSGLGEGEGMTGPPLSSTMTFSMP